MEYTQQREWLVMALMCALKSCGIGRLMTNTGVLKSCGIGRLVTNTRVLKSCGIGCLMTNIGVRKIVQNKPIMAEFSY